jgi:Spy/CpxP family protein refolding chaperone
MPIYTTIKTLMACMLLASLTAPGISHADTERLRRDSGSHPGRFIEEYAAQLGLEAETVTAIRAIVEATHQQNKDLWAKLHQAYAQMRTLLSQEMPDKAAVMQQADAIGAIELAARKNRLQAMLQIRALLKPAQRQELLRLQGEPSTTRDRFDSIRACQADSANLCSDAASGRARLQCLRDHVEALSETCRTALQSHRGDRQGPQ